jgi:hypothetical protein
MALAMAAARAAAASPGSGIDIERSLQYISTVVEEI